MTAREAIMDAIRANLLPTRPANVGPRLRARAEPSPGAPRGLDTKAERLCRFKEVLESAGGTCAVVASEDQAADALRRIVTGLKVRELAVSDAPLARRLVASLDGGVAVFDGFADRPRLLACDLGLTSAQWGIAETGSLVLESEAERHRLVSLVPPVHVAILAEERILATLGDALTAVRGDGDEGLSRAVTLITGPSRTADIELTLVVGVHGPKELHVIVISEEPTRETSP